jgi:poly(3-hydroxybutyrate) depolymerase
MSRLTEGRGESFRRRAAAWIAAAWVVGGAALAEDPSSRCGQSAQLSSGSQTVSVPGFGNRAYRLEVPSSYNQSNPYPVVFAYHPLGVFDPSSIPLISVDSWGELFCGQYYGDFRSIIGSSNAVIVCPEGLQSGGNWGWQHASDVNFFDAMLAQVSASLCIDLDEVFVTGHSMGGAFTNTLGCQRGDVIRAIAPVAGFGPSCSGGSENEVAALILHGTSDTVVSLSNGQASRNFWAGENGCDTGDPENVPWGNPGSCSSQQTYGGCASGYPVAMCTWNGYNHNDYWSIPSFFSGLQPPVQHSGGVAVEAAWAFFSSLSAEPADITGVFSNGFESGNAAGWSGAAGPVAVNAQADDGGTYGLEVDLDLTCSGELDQTLSPPPSTISGSFTACGSLTVEDVEIGGGGATLRAGELISLGDGFSVSSSLTVVLDPTLNPYAYVRDDSPSNLSTYGATFGVNLSPLSIDNSAQIDLLVGYNGGGQPVFRLVLRWNSSLGEHRLALFGRRDNGTWLQHGSDYLAPDNQWVDVEVYWRAGNGDGRLLVGVNGGALSGITTLANPNTRLESVRFGYAGGDRDDSSGSIFLDDFVSWSDN